MNNTMLYRPGKTLRVWNQYWVDTLIVPQDEVEQRLTEGWHLRPGDWEKKEAEVPPPPSGSLLDNPANVIGAALVGKPLEELEGLLAAEEGGKKRKGVLSAIQAEIDKRLAD